VFWCVVEMFFSRSFWGLLERWGGERGLFRCFSLADFADFAEDKETDRYIARLWFYVTKAVNGVGYWCVCA